MNGQNNDQNLSLNQIDLIFREIADTHAMINSYGEGLESEISTQTIQNYPLLWCTIQPWSIGQRTTDYAYRLYILDLVDQDKRKNLLEVQSDTAQIIRDVVTLLWDYYDMIIDFDYTVTPVTDTLPDMVTGCYIEIKITSGYSLGYCDIPLKKKYSPFVDEVWINDRGDYFMADDGDYFDFGIPFTWEDNNGNIFIDNNNNEIIV